jgi:hypothetical protein
VVGEVARMEVEVAEAVRGVSEGLMVTLTAVSRLFISWEDGSGGFAAFSKAPILYRKMILLTSVNPRWQEGLWYMGISQHPNSNRQRFICAQSEGFRVKVTRLGHEGMTLTRGLRVRSLVVFYA